MPSSSPEELLRKFQEGLMDKASVIGYLLSYIETSEDEIMREKCIKAISELTPKDENCFKLMENLIVSDPNYELKLCATKILITEYTQKSLEPIIWMLNQPNLLDFVLDLESIVLELEKDKAKEYLLALLKNFLKNSKQIITEKSFQGLKPELKMDALERNTVNEIINLIIELKYPSYIQHVCEENRCSENSWYVIEKGHVTELKFDGFRGNNLEQLAHLDRLHHLKILSFNDCHVKDMGALGLSQLTKLEKVEFSNERISEIKDLDKCSKLRELTFFNTGISTISGLENLRNLEKLTIERNYLTKIEGLDGLYDLKYLNLKSNRIHEFSGLEDLESLEVLILEDNQIKEVHGLEYFKDLKEINLKGNPISDINKYKRAGFKTII